MANIFTNAVKFIGTTLKQVATPDNLKSWSHASKIFVGSNYRLMPKTGFSFHVFFDINDSPNLSNVNADRSPKQTLGIMVKSVDLPKYAINTKTYNAYNRPNIVQNKINYLPISVTFHDDSANIVRNFWYDYFQHYYRDSDYGFGDKDAANRLPYRSSYKYEPEAIARFGYMPRREGSAYQQNPYLRSIRIYSLHQKRFSEYILINPIIREFRHGQHDYANSTGTMEHTMVVEYEQVIYRTGQVGPEVQGFASLEYHDLDPSPLKQKGGVKSIFGTGGLLDTAGSVLGDIQNGNFLAAAFKAARGINTMRGMNLKKSLVSELTGIYTQEASRAVLGQINQITAGTNTGRTGVAYPQAIDGVNKYNGINQVTSVAALAGAAIILNSTPITNKYQKNPTVRSTRTAPISNYSTELPRNPGVARPTTAPGTVLTIDQKSAQSQSSTVQTELNNSIVRTQLSRQIAANEVIISSLNNQSNLTGLQVRNITAQIGGLQSRLAYQQSLPNTTENQRLIAELDFRIQQSQTLLSQTQTQFAQQQAQITELKTQQNQFRANIAALPG
jgi:hypothetical protein